MDRMQRTALRAAVLIREQLATTGFSYDSIYFPRHNWELVETLQLRIRRAQHRDWQRAARRLIGELADAVEECRRVADTTARIIAARPHHKNLPSAVEIYRDILALYEEFEEVEIDFDDHELCVTTDTIVLEDLNFGRFKIMLGWCEFRSSSPYRVVALDPNPAAKSDDITHPHVQDERLCEGDGRTAIRAALSQCRLLDFFTLVSQVLHTYGRGGAYVELVDWDGVRCEDCGSSVGEDDRYCCNRCEETLCSECYVSCQACGDTFCSGCVNPCAACGCNYCSGCLKTCSLCHRQFCAECRQDGICQSCYDKQHEEEESDDPSPSARNESVPVPA